MNPLGYEPKGLAAATFVVMFTRRRASPQELEEGNRQMQQAQQRLDAEIAAGSELPLEDVKGMETMVPESPKSPVKEESLGREEGPRSFPASLVPAVPGQESQVMPATPESQVRTEVKTPAQKPEVREETSGAVVVQHEAVVPVVTEGVAADPRKIEKWRVRRSSTSTRCFWPKASSSGATDAGDPIWRFTTAATSF